MVINEFFGFSIATVGILYGRLSNKRNGDILYLVGLAAVILPLII